MSVIVKVPLIGPLTVGWKVTLMVQEAPAARLEAQLSVWKKLLLMLMLEMVRVALPVFVRVLV